MKKIIFITITLFSFGSFAASKDSIPNLFRMKSVGLKTLVCDACGSATGGSMGFSSILDDNFVGVRYIYQRYSSRDEIFANSPRITENFNTVQVWTKIPITEKVQITALIPYNFLNRELLSGNDKIKGLGDITVLGMFTAFSTKKDSTVFSHKLQVGGGLKIPSGDYRNSNNLGTVNPGFQLGSGSWDYLLATEYAIKHKKIGLNTIINYNFKTINDKNYKFGDQLNYGATFFSLFDVDKVKLIPQIGIAGEVYQSNEQHGQRLPNTSGDILFSKFGLEVGRNKLSLGINAMLPIQQNLTGGNVEAKYRWNLNLNYSL